jgi:hypothetical protein
MPASTIWGITLADDEYTIDRSGEEAIINVNYKGLGHIARDGLPEMISWITGYYNGFSVDTPESQVVLQCGGEGYVFTVL